MVSVKKLYRVFLFVSGIFFCISCDTEISRNIQKAGRTAEIEPDYTDVTIPPNIDPMNFIIKEEGKYFRVTATSGANGNTITIKSLDGIIRFPEKPWRKLLKDSKNNKIVFQICSSDDTKTLKQYDPFTMQVAEEPIDPYLAYRLIYPGLQLVHHQDHAEVH
jgi:hypothetical protein